MNNLKQYYKDLNGKFIDKCKNSKSKEYQRLRRNNPERKEYMRNYLKQYYLKNREILKQRHKHYFKTYFANNREKISLKRKQKYNIPEVKIKIAERGKLYEQRPEVKKRRIELRNKYERKLKKKMYSQRQEIKDLRNKNTKIRRELDLQFRLSINLRNRLRLALIRQSKYGHTLELLGCSIKKFIIYLESQFDDEMSWENYGKWHIDHIKPCASFDLSKEEEQRKCFHYSNLMPLWAHDNIIKGAKV